MMLCTILQLNKVTLQNHHDTAMPQSLTPMYYSITSLRSVTFRPVYVITHPIHSVALTFRH